MRLLLLISILLSQFAAGMTRWVTNTADSGTGSLRSAISSSDHSDRIEFDSTVFASSQVIRLTQMITISKMITIIGPRDSAGGNKVTLHGGRVPGQNFGGKSIFMLTFPGITLKYLDCVASAHSSGAGAIFIGGNHDPQFSNKSVIDGCRFVDNFSGMYGGAIRGQMTYRLEIRNCTFTNNEANFAGGAISILGGACYIYSSTFTGNRTLLTEGSATKGGGAVWFSNCQAVVSSCAFTGNQTPAAGGAIKSEITWLEFEKSTLVANLAEEGGALHLYDVAPELPRRAAIDNSTFSGNISAGPGAAVYVTGSGYGPLTHCTLTGNVSNDDGRIADGAALQATPDSTAIIAVNGCIVAKNIDSRTGGVKTPDVFAGGARLVSNGGNVIGDATGSGTEFSEAADRAGSPASPLDPGLLPLSDNGGGTLTHEPHPLSIAVDLVDWSYEEPDQRGAPRPSGTAPDSGAVERSVISYASWASANLSSYAAEERDQIDDPDRDGIPNALEFLQGTDPTSPSASNTRLLFEDGQPFYAFSISKSASIGEIAGRLGESPDLTEWTYTPLLGNASAIPDGSSGALHHYRIRPPAGEPRWFFRLLSGN